MVNLICIAHFRTLDPNCTCFFRQKLRTIRYHCSLTFYKCAIADSAMHSTLKFMSISTKRKKLTLLYSTKWLLNLMKKNQCFCFSIVYEMTTDTGRKLAINVLLKRTLQIPNTNQYDTSTLILG